MTQHASHRRPVGHIRWLRSVSLPVDEYRLDARRQHYWLASMPAERCAWDGALSVPPTLATSHFTGNLSQGFRRRTGCFMPAEVSDLTLIDAAQQRALPINCDRRRPEIRYAVVVSRSIAEEVDRLIVIARVDLYSLTPAACVDSNTRKPTVSTRRIIAAHIAAI